ncbi:hypothetical protein D3C80_1645460 [compost metagenome]
MGKLVDQQHMDFSALILEPVLLVLAVAEINLAAIPEANLVLDDLDELAFHPARQHRAKAVRSFNMVLHQIVADAAEEVDLQARYRCTPQNGSDAHQVALSATSGTAIQYFSCFALQCRHLLRMKAEV